MPPAQFNLGDRGRPQGNPRATDGITGDRPVIQKSPINNVKTKKLKRQINSLSAVKSKDPTNERIDDTNPSNIIGISAQFASSFDEDLPVSQIGVENTLNKAFKQTVRTNDTSQGEFNTIYSILPDLELIN